MPDSTTPVAAHAEPELAYKAKGFYYGGKWQAPVGSNTFFSTSPSTGKRLAEVPLAGSEDVDRAVKAAATAGTGSEVTPWATVWDRTPGAQKKYSLHLRETWAEAAVVDPELTLSLPAGPALAAGLDALSHSLESVWNVNADPISDTTPSRRRARFYPRCRCSCAT